MMQTCTKCNGNGHVKGAHDDVYILCGSCMGSGSESVLLAAAVHLRNSAVNKPLTARALADALDCFWNAALGDAQQAQDHTAFVVVGCIAEGMRAIAANLREIKL